MLQRVLVLEKNRETAARLQTALERNGVGIISLAPTMREACLIVAQKPQDLAFVPFEEADELLHSLRAFQPDLKMILTAASPNPQIPGDYRGVFQGLLHIEKLEKELPALLVGRPASLISMSPSPSPDPKLPAHLARLREACQEVGLTRNQSPVHLVVLSSGKNVLGYYGQGNKSQVAAVVKVVSHCWHKGRYTAQLQFLRFADYYDPRFIYSRDVSGAVLTIVAEPDVPVSDLRKLANRLARRLSDPDEEQTESAQSHFRLISHNNGLTQNDRQTSTFAIAWWPVKPLPKMLQDITEECIKIISREISCTVHHLSVTPTIVHLVIHCPPGKTAAWAIYQMKSGINQEIESRFGTHTTTIWRKGFYAVESNQPLNESELNMLLTP